MLRITDLFKVKEGQKFKIANPEYDGTYMIENNVVYELSDAYIPINDLSNTNIMILNNDANEEDKSNVDIDDVYNDENIDSDNNKDKLIFSLNKLIVLKLLHESGYVFLTREKVTNLSNTSTIIAHTQEPYLVSDEGYMGIWESNGYSDSLECFGYMFQDIPLDKYVDLSEYESDFKQLDRALGDIQLNYDKYK